MSESTRIYGTREWRRRRAQLLATSPRVCTRCGKDIPPNESPVAGHRIDRALGGTMEQTNLQVECLDCAHRTGGELRARIAHAAASQDSDVMMNRVANKRNSHRESRSRTTESGFSGAKFHPDGPASGSPLPSAGLGTDRAKNVVGQRNARDESRYNTRVLDAIAAEWTTEPSNSVWDQAFWLDELRSVPESATWPRLMSAPHPRAVGSWGEEFADWMADVRGIELRWWQRLSAYRILEFDEEQRLVWPTILLSTARQVGKSILVAGLAQWRITQAEWFGEEQLVIHTGKDLPVCREVQRSSRAWARHHSGSGWHALDANGKEEVSAPDGSRWMVRSKDAVYGYSASWALVDEAWDVRSAAVDDGLEPTMMERAQSQLVLTSTAHRRATSLFPSRRAGAIDDLASPDGVLLLEWSAREDVDLDDRAAWRMASPHWSSRREQMLARKLARALAGEGDVEDIDEDPVESFRSQYLNLWIPPAARLRGRDEPLLSEASWDAAADVLAEPGPGPLAVAVEDFFGLGASVGCAAFTNDGSSRVLVWGAMFPSRLLALDHAAATALSRDGSSLLVGASLSSWAAAALIEEPALTVEPVGLAQTRSALPALRDLLARRELAHDGGGVLSSQAVECLVIPGAAGLAVSPRSPRSDCIRAVGWAAQKLVDGGASAPFEIL